MGATLDLEEGVATAERWRAARGGEWHDGLDQSRLTGLSGTVADFPVADIERLAGQGHTVTVNVREGFQFARRVTAEPVIVAATTGWDVAWTVGGNQGRFEQVFPQNPGPAQTAQAQDDGAALLRLCAGLTATVTITITNHPRACGFHWARTTEAVLADLGGPGWLDAVERIFSHDDPNVKTASPRPQVLVVSGAGAAELRAPGLVVRGPDVAAASPAWPPDRAEQVKRGRAYAAAWFSDERLRLPAPVALLPDADQKPDGLAGIDTLLVRLTQGVAWLWLATGFEREPSLRIRFDGTPWFDLPGATVFGDDRSGDDRKAAVHAADLWEFAVRSVDALRHEAVQQGIIAAVRQRADLATAAEAALSRARFLHRLSDQQRMAETIAMLRSGRAAAIENATAVAGATRAAARSAIERVFAQVGAAIGIIVGHQTDVLNRAVAGWLIVVVMLLTLAIGAVAFLYEYPTARDLHQRFKDDLADYQDTLPPEDIDKIRQMGVLTMADAELSRSQRTTGFVLIVPVAVCLVALGFVLA